MGVNEKALNWGTTEPANPEDGSPAGWGVFGDMFSADNAVVTELNRDDLTYGGSTNAKAAAITKMANRGQSYYDQLKDIGQQNYETANRNAVGLGMAAQTARNAGVDQSENAQGLSDQARIAYQDARGIFGNAGYLGKAGNAATSLGNWQAGESSTDAAGRLTNYSGGNVDARLGNSYDTLQAYAQQGPGPSAAEAQLRQAQEQNVASQLALARSGRGAGANANAARQAAYQVAQINQETAGQAATLRAQEAAIWRNQQLQAYGQGANVAQAIEGAQQGRQGMGLQGLQAGANLYSQQDQQALAARQASAGLFGDLYGQTIQGQSAAENVRQNYLTQAMQGQQAAASQNAAAYQMGLSGRESAANLAMQGGQYQQSAMQSAQAAQSAYDQMINQLRENETQRRAQGAMQTQALKANASISNQRADLEKDASAQGLVGGLFSSAGSAMGGVMGGGGG